MASFEFAAPRSLPDALKLFGRQGAVRVLAGGTDVIDQLKAGRRKADLIVDIKRIPELQRLEYDAAGLHIGAARSCTDVHEHPAVRSHYAGLAEAAGLVGSLQIQNRATVCGNVCNAAPSADTTPTLLVHDAEALLASATGRRTVPLSDFFVGPGQTVLKRGEIMVGLHLPPPESDGASAYLRFIPRNEMDIAVVGVGAYLRLDRMSNVVRKARIALASVAPTPVRARAAEHLLEGKILNADLIVSAGEAAVEAASPISDVRGSAEYRKEMVKVLTRRVLALCRDRIASRS